MFCFEILKQLTKQSHNVFKKSIVLENVHSQNEKLSMSLNIPFWWQQPKCVKRAPTSVSFFLSIP